MTTDSSYDVVIVGAGHNGLVAACYLGLAGKRVLILEKNDYIGGATYSKKTFPGVDARLSVYSYLVSLLPQKILDDLGIHLELRRRAVASYTPVEQVGKHSGLLVSNESMDITRQSFYDLTGDEREYRGYQMLEEKLAVFARKIWPTLLSPLPSKAELEKQFQTSEEREIWQALVEQPLGRLIEAHLADDTARGVVFTDAKIGMATWPEDPSLLQNRVFLYHVIGLGTGEWRVPVGGMGALVDALIARARGLGVEMQTGAEVARVEPGAASRGAVNSEVYFTRDGKEASVKARFVLFNTSSNIANRLLPGAYAEQQEEGTAFKINMVLRRLPRLKDARVSASDAFCGTFHLNEGYERMKASYQAARNGALTEALPGEMYCHSLTDPSILSAELREKGYHTLTLFGLDVPYHWFTQNNEAVREAVLRNYLDSINRFIDDDINDCFAVDESGRPCIEARSTLDLENLVGLPKGNIFHGNLTWPFAENDEEVGRWGVETRYENVYICGSSARRGGAVSGIPGHNAAMKLLGRLGGS